MDAGPLSSPWRFHEAGRWRWSKQREQSQFDFKSSALTSWSQMTNVMTSLRSSRQNEVGHVGVEKRVNSHPCADVPVPARRAGACMHQSLVGLRARSHLCLAGSRLALLVSGEVPKGPYPTWVIRQMPDFVAGFSPCQLTTLYGSRSRLGPAQGVSPDVFDSISSAELTSYSASEPPGESQPTASGHVPAAAELGPLCRPDPPLPRLLGARGAGQRHAPGWFALFQY